VAESQTGGKNYVCSIEDGYVFERVWGRVTMADTEASSALAMSLGRRSGYRRILVDIEKLEWIDDLAIRLKAMELVHEGSQVFDRLALVSTRPAILYLISFLIRSGGITTRAFNDQDEALRWLMGP
jgi:hypothetical protein